MNDTQQHISGPASGNTAQLQTEPNKVSAGRGIAWLTEGWALLMKEPVVFAVMSLISIVVIFVLNLIPLLGSLATALLWPVMTAGFFLAFKHAKEQQSVTANDLFEPFKSPSSLVGVGGMYVALSLALMLVMILVAYLSIGSISDLANGHINMNRMGAGLVIMSLISIPAFLALAMAFVFAPILVHQHQVPVIDALKQSFFGSLRNILPFVLFFIVLTLCFFVLAILTAIPLIGWLIAVVIAVLYLPLFCGALFCAYRDIFLTATDTHL